MERGTIGELFEISLAREGEARSLYKTLANRFHSLPDAEAFFNSMADEESVHIDILSSILGTLTDKHIAEKAPEKGMAIAKRFLSFSINSLLDNIVNLRDACDAAINLEYSELNKLHEFLVGLHTEADDKKNELYSCLQEHLEKPANFKRSGIDLDFVP